MLTLHRPLHTRQCPRTWPRARATDWRDSAPDNCWIDTFYSFINSVTCEHAATFWAQLGWQYYLPVSSRIWITVTPFHKFCDDSYYIRLNSDYWCWILGKFIVIRKEIFTSATPSGSNPSLQINWADWSKRKGLWTSRRPLEIRDREGHSRPVNQSSLVMKCISLLSDLQEIIRNMLGYVSLYFYYVAKDLSFDFFKYSLFIKSNKLTRTGRLRDAPLAVVLTEQCCGAHSGRKSVIDWSEYCCWGTVATNIDQLRYSYRLNPGAHSYRYTLP